MVTNEVAAGPSYSYSGSNLTWAGPTQEAGQTERYEKLGKTRAMGLLGGAMPF